MQSQERHNEFCTRCIDISACTSQWRCSLCLKYTKSQKLADVTGILCEKCHKEFPDFMKPEPVLTKQQKAELQSLAEVNYYNKTPRGTAIDEVTEWAAFQKVPYHLARTHYKCAQIGCPTTRDWMKQHHVQQKPRDNDGYGDKD